MNDIAITKEQQEDINRAEAFLNGAKNFIVHNDDSLNTACGLLLKIKAKKKEYDELRKKLKSPINQAAKNIEDFFREPINYLTQAEQAYKKSILVYRQDQEKKAQEMEMQKLLKIDELSAAATEAIKNGDNETFDKHMDEIVEIESSIKTLQKIENINVRDNWKGRVINKPALLDAVVNGYAPDSLVKVDESALNLLAKAVKDSKRYPGIEFYNDQIVVAKTGS